jgi:hypothetical protein
LGEIHICSHFEGDGVRYLLSAFQAIDRLKTIPALICQLMPIKAAPAPSKVATLCGIVSAPNGQKEPEASKGDTMAKMPTVGRLPGPTEILCPSVCPLTITTAILLAPPVGKAADSTLAGRLWQNYLLNQGRGLWAFRNGRAIASPAS